MARMGTNGSGAVDYVLRASRVLATGPARYNEPMPELPPTLDYATPPDMQGTHGPPPLLTLLIAHLVASYATMALWCATHFDQMDARSCIILILLAPVAVPFVVVGFVMTLFVDLGYGPSLAAKLLACAIYL